MTDTSTVEAMYDDGYTGHATGRTYFVAPHDYQPLLDSFGHIVVQVDQDDYQGDSWVLYRDGDRYGFLTFGWGSCSGCDELAACRSWEDIEALRQQLEDSIRWGSADEVAAYLTSEHRYGDWYYGKQDWKQFREQAVELLEAA